MTRKILINALRQTAMSMEYCFYSGFDHRMSQSIIAYPAMWLSPPKITAVEGCNEGRIRYRVVLQLMHISKKTTQEQRDDMWCRLEHDAMELCRTLGSQRGIISVSVAECAPAEFSLTNHGEQSMSLKFDVEIPFCNL